VEAVDFLIEVACEFVNIGNFNCMMGIVTGLNSQHVSCRQAEEDCKRVVKIRKIVGNNIFFLCPEKQKNNKKKKRSVY
jgi:hypothetical protein